MIFPVRVERYALRDGSGGEGRHRGGRGVLRDYRILGGVHDGQFDGASVNASRRAAWRAVGDGALGEFVINPGKPDEKNPWCPR